MSDIIKLISDNLVQILATTITAVLSYIGIRLKNIINVTYEDKEKREIVDKTVKYVEQTCKDLSCEEKKKKAMEKSLEWLEEKKIQISDTELEILIESAVNCLD